MSKQGKAIAMAKLEREIKSILAITELKLMSMHPLIYPVMMAASVAQAGCRLGSAMEIPHQHFNSKGKIDKRKVKRYDRIRGKASTYMIDGRPQSIVIHDEIKG